MDTKLDNHEDESGLNEGQVCLYDNLNDCKTHGTTMLGLVAGAHLGVAKNVKPYLVRIPRRHPWGGKSKPTDWLEGVSRVLDKHKEDSKTTVSILCLAWYWTESQYTKQNDDSELDFAAYRHRLAVLIELLVKRGVFVVTGSGNQPHVSIHSDLYNFINVGLITTCELKMEGWPALYGFPKEKAWNAIKKYQETWHYIPDLLVVGALDPTNGRRWWMSGVSPDGTFPELYAQGDRILAVTGDEKRWPKPELLGGGGSFYKAGQGTSDGEYIDNLFLIDNDRASLGIIS